MILIILFLFLCIFLLSFFCIQKYYVENYNKDCQYKKDWRNFRNTFYDKQNEDDDEEYNEFIDYSYRNDSKRTKKGIWYYS
jgi:hypothetical protein